MAVSLRSFERRDSEAVVELSRLAFTRAEIHVGNPAWTTVADVETETADWDPPPEETLFVAEEGGRIVGFGGLERPRGFPHAELYGPLVASSAQGHKLGSRLLERSIELARTLGAETLVGAAGTRNAGAQMLLERHGFKRRGRPQATYRLAPGEHRGVPERGDVVIRPASRGDVAATIRIYRECFPEGRFSEAVWRENIGKGTVYVAELAGEVAGVLNIDPTDHWIYHVGVAERARRRGVGSYLLSRSLEDYWRTHPGERLGLDVQSDNVAAIRLYRRQGFAPWLVLQTFELPL